MRITKQQRDQIRVYLPRNWRKKVAEICNCAEITVSNVLNGRSGNLIIAEAIISLAKEQKAMSEAKKAELEEEIVSLKD